MKYFDCSGCKGGWCKGDGWECVPDSSLMEDAVEEQEAAKKALEQFYKSSPAFSDFDVRVEMLSDRQYQIFLEDKKENTAMVNRDTIDARMAALDYEPDREDLKDWLDVTPVLARIQRSKMIERYEQGGTVDELIEVFKEDYELDEQQLDSWYASLENLLDDYQERVKFMQSQ